MVSSDSWEHGQKVLHQCFLKSEEVHHFPDRPSRYCYRARKEVIKGLSEA